MTSRLRAATTAVATLALVAGALGGPVSTARAAGPFTLSSDTLAFGTQELFGSTGLSLTLTNADAVAHTVDTAVISSGTDDFTIAADSCAGASVQPAASCEISVRFRPSMTGARAGTLDIATDGGAGSHSVGLSGTGSAYLSSAWVYGFGDVPIGAPGVTLGISLLNMGGPIVSPTGTSLTGSNAADFEIVTDGCSGATLDAANSCEVTVEFTPSALGGRGARLIISGPAPLGDLEIALNGNGTSPASPVTWASSSKAGPNYTWNYGMSLARTLDGSTQRLHLVYDTERIGKKWAKDTGPYMGVYYLRSISGATWTTPKRINPSTQHGGRTATAASGARVYAVWVAQKKVRPLPTAERVVWLRVNKDHGAADKWKAPIRISSAKGRVDYPSVAASGQDVYVAWTDSGSGSIRLAISRDKGARWSIRTVGTTTYTTDQGYEGVPFVSVSGSNVAVAWSSDPANGLKVRTSADRGATWDPIVTLADESYSIVSVAVRGSRMAAAWTDAQGVVVSVRSGGTWGAPVRVATAVGLAYSPAVVLQDPGRVGVAYSDDDGSQSRLHWVESPDNGVAWYQPQTLATPSDVRIYNDWPSVVWPSAGTRIVAWNGWNYTDNFRLYARSGSGTPAGIPTVAPRLSSLAPAALPDGRVRHKTR